MAGQTIKSLMTKIAALEEQKDDLMVQLDSVTDKLQEQTAKAKVHDPSGGVGGAALLRDYCLYLDTLQPGLTVGEDYDLEENLKAAKHFWIEQGGEAEDLD